MSSSGTTTYRHPVLAVLGSMLLSDTWMYCSASYGSPDHYRMAASNGQERWTALGMGVRSTKAGEVLRPIGLCGWLQAVWYLMV